MISIEKITQAITKEADEYAEEVILRAKERAETIISEAKIKADKIITDKCDKAKDEADAIISRAASSAEILERNILLDAKSIIIDSIYKKAEAYISEMDSVRYSRFLSSAIDRAIKFLSCADDTENDGEEREKSTVFTLTLNEKDKKLFTKELLDFAAPLAEKTGRTIKLSAFPGNFSGGLRLSLGNIEADLTITALINTARRETESDVYGILFRQQEGEPITDDKI